ncbi:putative small-conductance mechanosensitive channel [Planococcus sp. PAMC 21323]|uniref:mechanosensitive ion channel family protein n=1 Tax=Planococcus sp. PAMC 21323 TaxID=1526927 RepID=UPI0005862A93|nr:mechanosensitive ion channel domain-containing protein [Planococcus sp. PAMC 21323]AIY06735.1 putative small-conductance mechanosensitive channel [Planococcus sp. PAMC 21323]
MLLTIQPEELTKRWYEVFEQIEWTEVLLFLFYIACIFLARAVVLGISKRLSKNRLFRHVDSILRSLLNWATTYGILLFMIFYFSDSGWMFDRLFELGNVEITVFLLILVVLIVSLANRASKIITRYILPNVYQRYDLDRGVSYTFDRMFHYTVMAIAIIVSLTTVGLNLGALTVFAGVLGVGIGFGLQNIASNFISGIILLFERPIKVGDRVIIDELIGDVEKISMRSTVIKTIHNEHVIVPNSYFLEEQVVNRSYGDPRMRLVIPVGVAYGTDADKVKRVLIQAVGEEQQINGVILLDPEPFVNFATFGESSLDFELMVWIDNSNQVIVTKSALNFRINRLFAEHDIEIPFPQRDLHIKSMPEIKES